MQQYIDLYEECREAICSHSAECLNAMRDAAYECFKREGLPTKKVERYRYTDVEAAFAPNYGLNINRLTIPVNPYDAFKCDVPNLSTALYFVVNDEFHRETMPKVALPDGVIVASFKQAEAKHAAILAKYLGRFLTRRQEDTSNLETRRHEDMFNIQENNLSSCLPVQEKDNMSSCLHVNKKESSCQNQGDGIVVLNTMLAQDGLLIYIPRGIKLEKTIQIINILRSDVDLMVNRRVLIVAEEGAEANILFCDHAADDRQFLATQVIEVFAEKGAKLQIYELEETHIKSHRFSNMYVSQAEESDVKVNSITLHNGETRNTTDVRLLGERASVTLNGCVISDKDQHVDNNTLIDHRTENCQSRELYKYVLNDNSVGAFAGHVLVRKEAQKTDSIERNANLCVTDTARMFTQPMLEIYADDVKCAHGSTVGQLNDAALFYMRQRGISEKEAKLLLQQAFVAEVIDTIELEPLRDRLRHLVEKRFRGELSKCEGCKLCK